MRRYFEIYSIMLRNSLIREMNFKANFLLWILVEVLWFAGQMVFIEVLYGHVNAIGDWSKWQMVLLLGTHQLIAQLFQSVFFMNVAGIPDLVRTGKLDFMLLLPIDAQFAVSTRQFGLDNVVNAGISVAVILLSLFKLQIQPGFSQIVLFIGTLGFGIAVHYSVMFFLATISFWIVRAQGLFSGYFNTFSLGRYPDSVFSGLFRLIFSWVIPIILISNVPSRFLMGTFSGSPWVPLLQLTVAAAFVVIASRWFWRFALTRYTSASS